jgi:hypothetical protein
MFGSKRGQRRSHMRKFTKLLLGAATVFSAAPGIAAQGRNSITGIAFDTSRQPIPDLRIELLDEVESRISTTQTDGAGRFSFQGLSDGDFLIRPVTVNTWFVTQTFRVQIFPAGGRGAHHEQLDLILKSAGETRETGSMNPGVIFAQKAPEEAQRLLSVAWVCSTRERMPIPGWRRWKRR